MKKHGAFIFLALLFITSLINTSVSAGQKNDIPSPGISKSHTSFDADINGADQEIERSHTVGYSTINGAHQGLQKIPGYLADNTNITGISSLTFLSRNATSIELFDNTCLYFNYPSHNFW